MFLRIALGTLLSSIAMFVWGAIYWTALFLPMNVTRNLSTEQQGTLIEALQPHLTSDGVYFVPSPDPAIDESDDAAATWIKRHQQGPIAQIRYRRSGIDPMSPKTLIAGFIHNLACTGFVAWLLASLRRSFCCYAARLGFVVGMGFFAGLWVEMRTVIWMYEPLDYQLFSAFYDISAWLVAGLVLAAVVKAPRDALTAPTCTAAG